MKYKIDNIYVLYRNGYPFRHFTVESQAKQYFCACRDLCPEDRWDLRSEEVSGDE